MIPCFNGGVYRHFITKASNRYLTSIYNMTTPTDLLDNLAEETVTDETELKEPNEQEEEEQTSEDQEDQTDNSEQEDPKAKRHSEQMEWARKEVQRIRELAISTAVKAASYDPESLVELNQKDPKLAKEVAKQLDFSQTERWTFENFLKWNKQSSEEDKEAYYKRRRAEELHTESIERATELINKIEDEDLRDKALEKFEKISEWKRLNYKDATEFAEMAIKYVWANKKVDSKNIAAAKASSTTVWKSNKNSSEEDWPYIDMNWKLVYPTTK